MLQVVAIDGPVGVGKSTVAGQVAAELGFRHLDTGAMYRAIAWKVMRLSPEEQADGMLIARIAREARLEVEPERGVFLDGVDITNIIRDESVSRFAGKVADNLEVRRSLVDLQRRIGSQHPSVLEGRDIGTVVFPDAGCKIYLDASPDVRVDRRMAQLVSQGRDADRDEVYKGLVERDHRDRSRSWGALRMAEDAILIDTTHCEEDRVVQLICSIVRENPLFQRCLATAHQ